MTYKLATYKLDPIKNEDHAPNPFMLYEFVIRPRPTIHIISEDSTLRGHLKLLPHSFSLPGVCMRDGVFVAGLLLGFSLVTYFGI